MICEVQKCVESPSNPVSSNLVLRIISPVYFQSYSVNMQFLCCVLYFCLFLFHSVFWRWHHISEVSTSSFFFYCSIVFHLTPVTRLPWMRI